MDLKKLRTRLGLSQQGMSELMGITRQRVYDYESGRRTLGKCQVQLIKAIWWLERLHDVDGKNHLDELLHDNYDFD